MLLPGHIAIQRSIDLYKGSTYPKIAITDRSHVSYLHQYIADSYKKHYYEFQSEIARVRAESASHGLGFANCSRLHIDVFVNMHDHSGRGGLEVRI